MYLFILCPCRKVHIIDLLAIVPDPQIEVLGIDEKFSLAMIEFWDEFLHVTLDESIKRVCEFVLSVQSV